MQQDFDARSALIASGDLFFNLDGTVDKRCSAYISGQISVTQSGHVHLGSSAIQTGQLHLKPTVEFGGIRRAWSEEEIENAWNKAETIPGTNPDLYRQDKVGNVIYMSQYGSDSPMGWNLDHCKPLAQGGTYHPNNTQGLQTAQNKSKNSTHPYAYDQVEQKGVPFTQPDADLRCSMAKSGLLHFLPNGDVDRRSAAVQSGEILVRKDGQVDNRSSAVKQGLYFNKPSVDQITSAMSAVSVEKKPSSSPSKSSSASSSGSSSSKSSSSKSSSSKSSSSKSSSSKSSSGSSSSSSGRSIQTGTHGGHYYINSNGNKTYV